uniref:Uncharacterized protein n=1 Tax=Polynucleobacter necessarius subsp. necessarius (strain STIR1) TaxID=452638 RepID=B1XUX5_POLNS
MNTKRLISRSAFLMTFAVGAAFAQNPDPAIGV